MKIIKSIAKFIAFAIITLLLIGCVVLICTGSYQQLPILLGIVVLLSLPYIISKIKRSSKENKQLKELIDYIYDTLELPTFEADNIILDSDEICHFNENAKLLKSETESHYVINESNSLFEDYRVEKRTNTYTQRYNGKLYVTNKRIIFISYDNQFILPLYDILKIDYNYSTTTISADYNARFRLDIERKKLFQAVANVLLYSDKKADVTS